METSSYGSPPLISGHHHHMPFFQLLQSAMQAGEETEEEEELLNLRFQQGQQEHDQSFFTSSSYPQESNFQLLLRLQSRQKQSATAAEVEPSRAVEQLDSSITLASESEAREEVHNPPTTTRVTAPLPSSAGSRERKKRKRSRAAAAESKSPEEVESQRMTHIAVERNRRRIMNDHLASLRSLMPSSYIQRGDQASIIGGAIVLVKELEQHLLSLRAEKRLRTSAAVVATTTTPSQASSRRAVMDDNDDIVFNLGGYGFFVSPQYTSYSQSLQRQPQNRGWQRGTVKLESVEEEKISTGVDVEATLVQGHVNLKVAGRRRVVNLVRAIAAMEELRLSVLHLSITSLDHHTVLYALNLKMEEECKLGSADEIATAVHQIFSHINAG